MKIIIDEIKPQIKILDSPKMKAIISLDFGDFLIKGFRILSSDKYQNFRGDNLWFLPPSYKASGGKYHPMFFCPDKNLWHQIEKKVYEEYDRKNIEYYKKEVDLGDIDLPS